MVLWKLLVGFLAMVAGAVALGIAGLIVGAFIGGNYAQDFTFNGMRGYEAVGQLGFIFGSIAGAVFGLLIALVGLRKG